MNVPDGVSRPVGALLESRRDGHIGRTKVVATPIILFYSIQHPSINIQNLFNPEVYRIITTEFLAVVSW